MITVSIRNGDKLDFLSIVQVLLNAKSVTVLNQGIRDTIDSSMVGSFLEAADTFLSVVKKGRIDFHLIGRPGVIVTPDDLAPTSCAEAWGEEFELLFPLDNDLSVALDRLRETRVRNNTLSGDWAVSVELGNANDPWGKVVTQFGAGFCPG